MKVFATEIWLGSLSWTLIITVSLTTGVGRRKIETVVSQWFNLALSICCICKRRRRTSSQEIHSWTPADLCLKIKTKNKRPPLWAPFLLFFALMAWVNMVWNARRNSLWDIIIISKLCFLALGSRQSTPVQWRNVIVISLGQQTVVSLWCAVSAYKCVLRIFLVRDKSFLVLIRGS